jgi:uncharacterized protein with von Willebrand factor type A (vWA) domain
MVINGNIKMKLEDCNTLKERLDYFIQQYNLIELSFQNSNHNNKKWLAEEEASYYKELISLTLNQHPELITELENLKEINLEPKNSWKYDYNKIKQTQKYFHRLLRKSKSFLKDENVQSILQKLIELEKEFQNKWKV